MLVTRRQVHQLKKKIKNTIMLLTISGVTAYGGLYFMGKGYINKYDLPFLPDEMNFYLFLNGYKLNEVEAYIPDAPLQKRLKTNKDFTSKDKKYRYVAHSTIQFYGRVLSIIRYRIDDKAEISPYDMASGWLDMSRVELIRNLRFSQGDRRLYTDPWDTWAPDDPRISMNFTNMHIIPANSKVMQTLSTIKKYDVFEMEGYLVDVRGVEKEYVWNSSRTRADIGRGSSEIIYVTGLRRLEPPIKLE
ncbi:MAG: hypothetical protein PQ612_07250 [Rickettsiales bacterium]|nr:hypothetical protein [Pseudomonadota bacterium]MDA0965737.1 hypothetical protein [Pseudomonadota bacterium]MDG4543801.1 hypothetical protein [Rickettsiales bacterium]MDG4545948.1 hypothetical protein [Rickettsiales bacterium]MDG4548194.1 hypothetical protein [Rickettsiales bacterium]